jgi:hypothetical protein
LLTTLLFLIQVVDMLPSRNVYYEPWDRFQNRYNERKSAASFCSQVAAWLPDMFWNCYLVKNHKIAKNSTTTKAREKIITDLELLEF